MTYRSVDYYRDQIVGERRIGDEFTDCHIRWSWPAGQLVLKNDSILTDIEYSFDGEHVAGRLNRGTVALSGGELFVYNNTIRLDIYIRRAHDADGDVVYPNEVIVPFRLWVDKEPGGP